MINKFRDNVAIIVTVLLLVSILISAGYLVTHKPEEKTITLPMITNCKLQHQPCVARMPPGGQLEFEVLPRNPNAAEELLMYAKFSGFEPEAVKVNYNGKTMNMGFLDYPLKRISVEDNKTTFSGKGGLSVCIRGVMEWKVTVSVKLNNIVYQIPFEMETFYNPGS